MPGRNRAWLAVTVAGALALAVTGCGHGGTGHGGTLPAAHSSGTAAPSPAIPGTAGDQGVESAPSSLAPGTQPATPRTYATYGVSYRVATGSSPVVGPAGGALRRYQVAVQVGLAEPVDAVAARVEQILGDTARGWVHNGRWRFQRVASGPVDFVVELTTARDTEAICTRFGLHTRGVVSCRGGKNVVINETRWRTGTDGVTTGATRYSPEDYQILVINHEVGHALGHSHVGCPGTGRPAPVMMTQYFGLHGCVPNIWPYAATGEYVN